MEQAQAIRKGRSYWSADDVANKGRQLSLPLDEDRISSDCYTRVDAENDPLWGRALHAPCVFLWHWIPHFRIKNPHREGEVKSNRLTVRLQNKLEERCGKALDAVSRKGRSQLSITRMFLAAHSRLLSSVARIHLPEGSSTTCARYAMSHLELSRLASQGWSRSLESIGLLPTPKTCAFAPTPSNTSPMRMSQASVASTPSRSMRSTQPPIPTRRRSLARASRSASFPPW